MATAVLDRPRKAAKAKKKAPRRRRAARVLTIDPVTQYARDIADGRIVAGRPVRLACARHLRDLEHQGTPAFPYQFNPEQVAYMCDFFQKFLTLDDVDAHGEPRPFALVRWLKFCFGSLIGWTHVDTGHLRFVEGYMESGKGTTKTPAAAGFGLYRMVAENRHAVELYSAGVNADQANYLYGFAKRMAERSEDLEDLLVIGEYNMAWEDRNSFFRPLTSEGRSLDNKKPFTALIDELHEHPTPVIPEKMRLGIKSQEDALVLMFTNSGHDKTSVCWTKHDYAVKVLEGAIVDETFFGYVCQLDPCDDCRSNGATQPDPSCKRCDDWQDERHWPKVNPAIIDIPSLMPYLRGVVSQAVNQPSTLPRILRLNFCIWTQGHSVWIPFDKWEACKVPALATAHEGRACAAGFDMSEKSDLTACVLALRIDDDHGIAADAVELVDSDNGKEIKKTLNINFCVELHTFFWLPRETLIQREKDEHIPLSLWERLEADGPGRGLRVTLGPVIDYDQIYDEFRQTIAPPFKPDRVGYDKHNASQFALQLRDKAKFTVVEVPQGRALSESFKLFDALVRLRRIRHIGNPVMTWCVSNADPKRDRYENLWLEKPSHTKRIDGVIAAVIALNQLVGLPAKRRTGERGRAWTITAAGLHEIPIGENAHA